jgi:predicted ATPase
VQIKRVKIENFKSFNSIDIDLHQFNVLIGANASGKTNFIQFFKFLQDTVHHGLDNAISMQGGIDYLRNINIGAKRDLSASITYETLGGLALQKK